MKSRVGFADLEIKKAFLELKGSTTEDSRLYEWLNRAFDDLAENAFCGIQIPKKQIPREYVKKYGMDNLWKYNLPNAWRLVFFVKGGEAIVLSVVIEWLDHQKYCRKFGYENK